MQIFAVRGLRAITFVSEFPYRKVQVVLRLYKTLAEVLHGFDVDACSVGFDGHTVRVRLYRRLVIVLDGRRQFRVGQLRHCIFFGVRRGFYRTRFDSTWTSTLWERAIWIAASLARTDFYFRKLPACGRVLEK